jgi:hypothetical protein
VLDWDGEGEQQRRASGEPAAPPPLGGQLAAMQAKLDELTAALERRPTEDSMRGFVDAEIAQAVDRARTAWGSPLYDRRIRAVVDAAVSEAWADLAVAVEHRPTEEAMRAVVEAAAGTALAQARTELAQALTHARVEHTEALADAQAEVATSVARRPTEEATRALVDAAMGEALAQARAELSTLAAAVTGTTTELDRVRVAQEQFLAVPPGPDMAAFNRLREELAAATEGEHDVQHGLSRLSAMVEALRSDLEDAIDHAAQDMAALISARAELEQRLGALARSIDSAESGLHGVEQRILEELYRVNVRLERLEGLQRPVSAPRIANTLLVETLDAQLQAAESRLAARAGTPKVDLLIEPSEPGSRFPPSSG